MNIGRAIRSKLALVIGVAILGHAPNLSVQAQAGRGGTQAGQDGMPEFLSLPPSPFAGPASDRLARIVDHAPFDERVVADALRRAEQAKRAKRVGDILQAEIEAALALSERG